MTDKLQLRTWQQIAQAKAFEYAGTPEANEYLCESRRYALAADRIDELLAENDRLQDALTDTKDEIKVYKPAQRAERTLEPVKAVGPCNFAFWHIVETDEEFAERAGTEVEELIG